MQALVVAVGGSGSLLFCWVSAAVIALVTLRKGATQGLWLFVWALLPAGLLAVVFGDTGPLTLLSGTLVLALVLRNTVSLPLTLLAGAVVGVVTGLAMLVLGGEYLKELVATFSELLDWLEQRAAEGANGSGAGSAGNEIKFNRPQPVQVAGMLGSGTAVLAVLSLLLGRYWQASLYNPGGFGVEFRALRYPVGVSTLLVLVALAFASMGTGYSTWAMMFFIPLSFAGLALVHARVAAKGQGSDWLGWFYLVWFLLDPVKLVVVFFAIADSWLDFRERWAQGAGAKASKKRDSDDDV